MCSLKLSAGYSIIDYNHNKYKLKKIFIEELKQRLKLKKKLELETFHHLFDVKNNFEELRQQCFLIFKTEKFKQSYLSIVKDLIQTFFSRSALVQKFPTIRIQSPSQSAAPYHNDNWFGHGKDVINFWLPLSQIDKYNSLRICKNQNENKSCLDFIIKNKLSLSKINSFLKLKCEPVVLNENEILCFKTSTLHGTEISKSEFTRFSIDFRIAPSHSSIGSKPINNFYNFDELNVQLRKHIKEKKPKQKKIKAFFYSNLCNSKSAKSQLMLCVSFCKDNSIDIVGGDSEILIFDYLPVLRNNLENKNIDAVVVFGVDIFSGNKKLAKSILELAIKNNKKIIFCAESIFFSKDKDKKIVLRLTK